MVAYQAPSLFFFLNDPPTPEFSPLPLHDALPIFDRRRSFRALVPVTRRRRRPPQGARPDGTGFLRETPPSDRRAFRGSGYPPDRPVAGPVRSEEHTSELQSQSNLVCRLLLEKKKT